MAMVRPKELGLGLLILLIGGGVLLLEWQIAVQTGSYHPKAILFATMFAFAGTVLTVANLAFPRAMTKPVSSTPTSNRQTLAVLGAVVILGLLAGYGMLNLFERLPGPSESQAVQPPPASETAVPAPGIPQPYAPQ